MSRYPAGCRFAFTIVHDADSAYSRRLAPLFDVFDELGFRLTVSVFALWADWARGGRIWDDWRAPSDAGERLRAPIAVPLCDPDEATFYRSLAARGHEIALHTPSETSSTREDLVHAFDLFERQFGRRPPVYVEHSSRSNKDALSHEGANPSSPFYCEDLLRESGAWIWVDGAGALHESADGKPFEIQPHESPINRAAQARYGLPRAFVRTGAWAHGDGNGFLQSYSPAHVDLLEQDGGMALAYTHLNFGWLDPDTGLMRSDIRARLEYLASKPGWFVPAGEVLTRAEAVDQVTVDEDRWMTVTNRSRTTLHRLLVQSDKGDAAVIERLEPGAHVVLKEFSG